MEYNISDIIEWLKSKAAENVDNHGLQRKYFEAMVYMHKLDVVLKRIALEKVNVESEETEPETANTDSDNQEEIVEEITDNTIESVGTENNTDETEA